MTGGEEAMTGTAKASSASYLVEFVRGRPKLEAACRKVATDPFKAPELAREIIAVFCLEALQDVTAEERQGLERTRGNGAVDWDEVRQAFAATGGGSR